MRDVDGIGAERLGDFSRSIGRTDESLGRGIGFSIAAIASIFDHEFESADGAETIDRGRRKDRHESFLNLRKLPIESPGDGKPAQLRAGAIFKVIKGEKDDSRIRAGRETMNGKPRKTHCIGDARRCKSNLRHFADDLFSAVER